MKPPRFGDPPGKGWFAVDGVQEGDRRVEDQLRGLDLIAMNCRNRTVLDLGSAEGLIANHLCKYGATAHCVEIVSSRVETGRRLCSGRPVKFWCSDVSCFCSIHRGSIDMMQRYDIVLALAILHKLNHPDWILEYIAKICRRWLAIRLPEPTISDRRSDFRPLNVPRFLSNDFDLVSEARTFRNEWTAVFQRI